MIALAIVCAALFWVWLVVYERLGLPAELPEKKALTMEPPRPQGVRLHTDTGLYMLDDTLRYVGVDEDGLHVWSVVGPVDVTWPAAGGGPTLNVEDFPAQTSISVLVGPVGEGLVGFVDRR